MGTQENMEREINLIDIFWGILFNWRQILCVGIVFAVLLSGVKYARDIKNYQKEQNVTEEQGKTELTESEEEQVESAKELMERIEEYEDYLNTSVYMQLNPYEKHVLEMQYFVKSDYTINYTEDRKRDYTEAIMAMYGDYVTSGEMSQKTIKEAKLSVSQAEFSELRSYVQSGTSIKIVIAYPEEEKLGIISESVKAQLEQKEEKFQELGSHELILVRESQNVVVDTGLLERKNSIANNIATINTQLNTLKADMTDKQLSLLDSEQEENIREVIKPEFNFIYMILGAFLGAFLMSVWTVCKIFFTVKLQNSEEICTLYKVRLLGEIKIQPKKKYFLSAIDDKLLEIKNRKKKKLSTEQQVKMVSAKIALSCQQNKAECIYMTGSEYENADVAILDMLKKELIMQGIQVKEGGNIFYDAESLKEGTAVGNLLFVEQKKQSIYSEISNELNLAKEQNNNILGIVVLT